MTTLNETINAVAMRKSLKREIGIHLAAADDFLLRAEIEDLESETYHSIARDHIRKARAQFEALVLLGD